MGGDVDAHTAPELRAHLLELLRSGDRHLVVDLDGVEFMDSSGLGVLVAVVYSGVLTAVIALAIKYTIGLRLDEEDEVNGIDLVAHGESAYDLHSGTSGGGSSVLAASTAPATTTSKTEGASA